MWLALCPATLLAGPSPSAPRDVMPQGQNFTEEELDELLAPVALYPDPLLAQVLPAATFVDQLDEASRVLGGRSDDQMIADRDWDISVKSVAHYPQVLQRMVQKRDWTTALGQAYVDQSTDVLKSVQRLRAEARAAGSLVTTPQQTVVVEGQVIKVVPAQPQVIYVPQYNPEVVYVKEDNDDGVSTGTAVAAAAISFGVGMAIGAWLNNDCDWNGYRVFYHGWSGGGWIGVNRTFVNVNRNIYVNRRYTNINVNRTVVNRNVSSYRNTLRRDADVRRERIGNNGVNRARIDNARRDAAGNRADDLRQRTRNNDSRNDALRSRDVDRERLDAARGRETRERPNAGQRDSSRPGANGGGIQRPADSGAHSIFGGGGGNEARAQRERGAASRAQMQPGGLGNRGGGNGGGLGNRGGNRGGGLGGRRRN
jgi:hypothetical protein